ncbi:hypothetical protein Bca52824_048157 [Brassica carinata]|uniref:Uncharacterized protein n=1 Tax=Brassica carinata TaxID=52824 RepID=A0A8X7RIG2_BRACI|nr:hypothetical protein Bca52824_048157 [Brassica carinata]
MADFLAGELIDGGTKEKVKPLVEIRILTKTSCFNRSRLVEAGVVESLMKLLRLGDRTIQENTMAAILNLSKGIAGKVRIGGSGGGLEMIVEVLNEGARAESRKHAAAAIFYLSSLGDYCRLIGEIPSSIPGLLRIVKGCDYGDSAKRNALIAIRNLLIRQSYNNWRVLVAGAVSVLLDLVRSGEVGDGVKANSIAILAKIAEYPDGMISVLRRGGLKLTVKILSLSTKQHCVVLLLNLCVNGGSDVVGALAKDPSIVGSLYMVLSNGDCGVYPAGRVGIRKDWSLSPSPYDHRTSLSPSSVPDWSLLPEELLHILFRCCSCSLCLHLVAIHLSPSLCIHLRMSEIHSTQRSSISMNPCVEIAQSHAFFVGKHFRSCSITCKPSGKLANAMLQS